MNTTDGNRDAAAGPPRDPLDEMDWSWAGPPLDTRPLFPLERAELVAVLRQLDAGDWQRPTVCPGWCVHDVTAHVVHDYLRKLSGTRDGHAAPGPRPGETMPGFLHRMNEEFVHAASRWSPQVLIGLLGHLGPQLDQLWASLSLDRLGEAVSWAAPGQPAPVWLDIAREYSEYWVHQQQIRDAVSCPGANGERLIAPVIDTFLRSVPYTLRQLTADPGTCVHIQVTGPGGGTWSVQRQDATRTVDHGPPRQSAAALVQLSSDSLWRVATRGALP
ncbi:MAG TPA: maleylpyruvate isomerase family mycothiol-dependent enzyme [Streptosporangiaceae bacterium]